MTRPYMLYDSAIPLVFDGSLAQCFIVVLRNSVNHCRVKNIAPGVLYTFVFRQQGGFEFTWPATCRNATEVKPEAGTSVQNFIGNTGGYLDVHAAGTWGTP